MTIKSRCSLTGRTVGRFPRQEAWGGQRGKTFSPLPWAWICQVPYVSLQQGFSIFKFVSNSYGDPSLSNNLDIILISISGYLPFVCLCLYLGSRTRFKIWCLKVCRTGRHLPQTDCNLQSGVPSEPAHAQIPCLVQRDSCGCVSPYIALMRLLTVGNSLAEGEWCCTRPGQPYFKQELSAGSVQGQPLWLFLSGNYSSYKRAYAKQTPWNPWAAAFFHSLAPWRLAKKCHGSKC